MADSIEYFDVSWNTLGPSNLCGLDEAMDNQLHQIVFFGFQLLIYPNFIGGLPLPQFI